ncbi:MAG TPA: type II toxin-antitoxin system RelE/ParE family toxin [Syntrophorhabdaceae bacterium]|nr:type II toxin-antitoxin system RelE/ParE family toxin [Syntrophorhabdaceae bacterium]
MVGSIKHKGLAALYYEDQTKGVKQEFVKRLRNILVLLDTAFVAEDMNIPGLRFHQLKGDLAGFYSVSVSGNWRVIFRFGNGQATDVDLIDYH